MGFLIQSSLPKFLLSLVNLMVVFDIPHPMHTFTPESCPHFALKMPNPGLQKRNIPHPKTPIRDPITRRFEHISSTLWYNNNRFLICPFNGGEIIITFTKMDLWSLDSEFFEWLTRITPLMTSLIIVDFLLCLRI